MRKILLSIFIAIVAILNVSCTTTHYVARQDSLAKLLVGEEYHTVVSILGTPTRYDIDGNGGTVLIYDKDLSYDVSQARRNYYSSSAYASQSLTSTYTNYIKVYMDSKGVCYNVHSDLMREQKKFSLFKTSLFIIALALGGYAVAK